jgi:lipoic acid synthetase
MTLHHQPKPAWLKTPIPGGETYFEIKKDLRERKLATVCEEAKCPNIGECWSQRTATFMICGDTCTRACRFCHIKTGNPEGFLNPHEPQEVAQSTLKMGLRYVVITMVDRDDLPDGGAHHVASVIHAVRETNPGIVVEFLGGDFQGNKGAMGEILATGLQVYAHNLETIARLTPRVRDPRARYSQSLDMLQSAKSLRPSVYTKSSLMLGLGETEAEIEEALVHLRGAQVDFLTLGQYMRPTKKHLSVKEWVPPERFESLKHRAQSMGFLGVAAGPLVRSSYKALQVFQEGTHALHRPIL